ncbi:MAG: hypothetical protein KBD65_01720 [Candidatus Moranbacteria bacterium]|nr:hypothetical protein [Candidatus Moranbacteria bacterium]
MKNQKVGTAVGTGILVIISVTAFAFVWVYEKSLPKIEEPNLNIVVPKEEDTTVKKPRVEIRRLRFTLHADHKVLTLGFRDDQGYYSGSTVDEKIIKKEIPGSQYQIYGGTQYLSLPLDTTGQLELVGIADAKFSLEVQHDNDPEKQVRFGMIDSRIVSKKDTFVRMRFDQKDGAVVTEDLKLEIDLEHNGEFQSLTPIVSPVR